MYILVALDLIDVTFLNVICATTDNRSIVYGVTSFIIPRLEHKPGSLAQSVHAEA